ncbi:hypothetical protein KCP75_20660 [Salmonella enterica subsp. enterica]|nr:hypothetical protein KCP75_20660 [Salmonella enterica subsp. enterica]
MQKACSAGARYCCSPSTASPARRAGNLQAVKQRQYLRQLHDELWGREKLALLITHDLFQGNSGGTRVFKTARSASRQRGRRRSRRF